MRPAFSVIFFTVTAGMGYGLMFLLMLVQLINLNVYLSVTQIFLIVCIALVFITAGLLSSTLHLANPTRAWRAFSRFRTSWLSREGILAVIFYPVVLIYLISLWIGKPHWSITLFISILAILTLFATGMIYACLKTIRQWYTPLTPINYVLLGIMLGGLLFVALLGDIATGFLPFVLSLIAIAASAKLIYYGWLGQPTETSINTATGFSYAIVRLLEIGHTADTFVTREFNYSISALQIRILRSIVFIMGFILPAILLGYASVVSQWLAVIIAYSGILLERWLFFAEARHVVNLYHGLQSV
ncbi:dimethyl sulfoxide reductase anchor subunit family protein [Beggiatoa leptomitoformis]|uniref:DMSO reductase n=1 Tax=Beggiatoa leptomitoformis TaxID=288004 RepID=A0A2N9YHB2_9GAMM|nr:DmsC/YnfH family molybdoenzyme membrane anchor subunit [Beggiatoa leptomitoformis]ALG67938.1 DMSO reductase [Beggiatoa leptomitoformis]AUI69789.1 DMSO reductase [Beggiatoa leptomitoformis]